MDNEMMIDWLHCFVMCPGSFFHISKSILLMDSMRAHVTDNIKEILKHVNTIPAIIPGGITKFLQPLDIAVNRGFKSCMRQHWEAWMTNGKYRFTETGKMQRATSNDVWIPYAWNAVPTSCILSGFYKAEICPDTEPFDDDSSDDEDNLETGIPDEISQLFHSDTEDEDFHGFVEDDLIDF